MLTIRLARIGRKNRAQFQIVLQEHTIAPGGKHIEVLGGYDPHSKKIVLKEEKIKYWLGQGAQSSDTVHNLFIKKGILTGEKRKVKLPKKTEAATVGETIAPAAEAKSEKMPIPESPTAEEIDHSAGKDESVPTAEKPKAE